MCLSPLPALLLGASPVACPVGWLGFLTTWRLRAAGASVPGEPCRSYIAFGDLAQNPTRRCCKFKSAQTEGEEVREKCVSMGGTPVSHYETEWDEKYGCGSLWEMQPVAD